MKNGFSYRWLMGAFIALFFALQSYSLSHAASYGDAPHEHEGVSCSVTVLAEADVTVEPAPTMALPVSIETVTPLYQRFVSQNFARPQSRAPPPRGPPTTV